MSRGKGRDTLIEITRIAHEHLEKGEVEKATEHFERAATEAESVEDSDLKISCFLNAGACFVSLGQYDKGLRLLESAAGVIKAAQGDTEEGGNPHMLASSADVHYNSAVACQGLKDHGRAVREYATCVELYEKAGYRQQAADALASLAACHRESGQRGKEKASLIRAQQLYRELEDHRGDAIVCTDMARACLSLGETEQCKQMLSRAKVICSRVDDQKTQGKLHSQFGLIYCSLQQFDEAILSFERALPLVRVVKSKTSQQLEASILQNIGAAYNEKGMHSESLAYHTEAAALHCKMENHNSEIKCLCNLAFARSQLRDYSASASSFSEAFTKAQAVNNLHLQFQAREGQGACHYHMKQYSEAASSFNSALELLDQMEGDTGLARERVMEKLSDATEALGLSQGQTSDPLHSHGGNSGNIPSPLVSSHSSTSSSPQSLHYSHGEEAAQLRPQCSTTGNCRGAAKSSQQCDVESSPKPEQRGGRLPPVDQPKSRAQPTASPASLSSPQQFPANASQATASSKHIGTSSKRKKTSPKSKSKGKGKEKRKGKGRDRTKSPKAHPAALSAQDSYDLEIQAYQETLMSSEGSSGEEDQSAVCDQRHDTPDHLGSSMFSRHATKSHQTQIQQQPSLTPISSLSSLSQGQSNPEIMSVQEGSLAIGPNARDNYTLQSSRVKSGQKGRKGKRPVLHTEIIPKGAAHHSRGANESSASGHPSPPPQSTGSSEQQSKVCAIL